MKKIEAIFFDLGGVLVELGGMNTMHTWMNNAYSDEKLMELWLASNTVREFESGKCSVDKFIQNIVSELKLPIAPETFHEQFKTWPSGLFPGVKELLVKLRKQYTLISLSNTNQIHWPVITKDLDLESYFDHHLPSHLTGLLKPDHSTFQNALDSLGLKASSVLFFDDSQINVAAAQKMGIEAFRTVGFKELKNAIYTRELLKAA